MAKFSFATEEGDFDQHIRQSIRGYDDLHNDVVKLSEYFVDEGTTVLDIGCSTGTLLKDIKEYNQVNAEYRGIEVEKAFRLKGGDYYVCDVRDFHWNVQCSLITSIFTLQFVPKKDRQAILSNIYDALVVGGAFIFAEKVYLNESYVQEMLTFCYYDYKQETYTPDKILEKEKRLRNMMRPNTTDEILRMIGNAGFPSTTQFWQNHLFKGWICTKQTI